jgi:hypothetical protein
LAFVDAGVPPPAFSFFSFFGVVVVESGATPPSDGGGAFLIASIVISLCFSRTLARQVSSETRSLRRNPKLNRRGVPIAARTRFHSFLGNFSTWPSPQCSINGLNPSAAPFSNHARSMDE